MRFLANENVTATVIRELRQRGHDVLSAKESMRSHKDEVILARAQAEERIVVTHDKDFGELAFRSQLPASCGVILSIRRAATRRPPSQAVPPEGTDRNSPARDAGLED